MSWVGAQPLVGALKASVGQLVSTSFVGQSGFIHGMKLR
jgi:hypothetical protein